MSLVALTSYMYLNIIQVAESLGDKVKVLKIDVDENPELSSQLKIEGLPTIVFIPKEAGKPALRTEGLLPAQQIMDIVAEL
jgi:thioredoxin-like negative regulator of GroEL